MSTFDWTEENGGTLGAGGESEPVKYPRSDADRAGGLPEFEENSAGNADEAVA